jgi:hypothetical protein
MREPQHKLAVKVVEVEEAMELGQCLRGQPIADDLDLGWVHMHTLLIHNVSQLLYSLHVEGTLLQIDI